MLKFLGDQPAQNTVRLQMSLMTISSILVSVHPVTRTNRGVSFTSAVWSHTGCSDKEEKRRGCLELGTDAGSHLSLEHYIYITS